ncbi:MAG: fumarylacetoacetate hydrolase family protein [Candidatus Hydrogenedentota bacterium]
MSVNLIEYQELPDIGEIKLPAPLSSLTLGPVIPYPPKFLAIGLNYADHVAETGREKPQFPVVFNKQRTCANGPYADVYKPRETEMLDYEGELAFVIGRRCRRVSAADAPKVIAGYTIVNDVSVRDWQRLAPTLTLGKSWDTHGPMGPWLVTPDELGDPHNLPIRTYVNGALRQESNTRHLMWNCYQLVEILSTVFTLEPGDVIATGTPAGVGMAMDPPTFLNADDVVRVEIDGIGHIENRIIDEPEPLSFIDGD